jgi:glycosyltransferase involved in cell wall biosynthesis
MRVGFDHQIFEEQRSGGVLRYCTELIAHLSALAAGCVSVVAPCYASSALNGARLRAVTRGIYVPVRFRGADRLRGWVNGVCAPLMWGRSGIDIVHETYYSMRPIGKGRRRVVTLHDMIPELFPAQFAVHGHLRQAKLAAVRRADHVICVSESTKRDLLRLLEVDASQVSVVHLGHEFPEVSLEENRSEGGLESAPRNFILYVGRRDGYKNFDALVRAYEISPTLRARIPCLAFGGGSFTTEERTRFKALGLCGSFVQRSGDDRALNEAYRTAAALVYPSLYEGFGMPPLEAMARGCPVICSNVSSIPEVVGESGLYFDPRDPAALAGVLERFFSGPALAREMRDKGLVRSGLFSWERCAAETLRIYNSLV